MAKITRVYQKQFGELAGASEIAKFGSLAAGTPEFAATMAEVQSYAQFSGGWFDAVLGENSPAIEDMNALFKLAFYQLAYLLQQGVAEWDTDTVYYIGSMATDSGVIYKSLTDDNQGNPVTDTANWQRVGTGMASQAPGATISSNYTVVDSDNGRVLNVDTSAGAFIITLPAISEGFVVTIKDVAGQASINPVTIARTGTPDIDSTNSDDRITDDFGAKTYLSGDTAWTRPASFAGGAPTANQRAVYAGGIDTASTWLASIDYNDLSTPAAALNFGNLSAARAAAGACASSTRAVYGGGTNSSFAEVSTIEYSTLAVLGSLTAFGNLTSVRQPVGLGSNTRGIFAGSVSGSLNEIDYITIAVPGGSTVFGTLSGTDNYYQGACASPTRGVIAGKATPGSTMQYLTIASPGNGIFFGNLLSNRFKLAGCSNSTRGVFAGGYDGVAVQNTTEYITIATLGNAISFGNLLTQRYALGSAASQTIGLFAAGIGGGSVLLPAAVATCDYVTFATLASIANFGNLTIAKSNFSGTSGAHGGI